MTTQLLLLFVILEQIRQQRRSWIIMRDAYHLDFHIPKLLRIPVLWCATLLLEHVIVWRLHFFILSQRDSGRGAGGVAGMWCGGGEDWGGGFAPRSVFSKCLWSNQVPRRRRRRELIAGKVFLTFASNHSSLLISIIYFSSPLHILPLTNLFHQLHPPLPFCLPLPACLMSNSLRDGATASSHAGFSRNARKRNYWSIKENVSVLEWHSVA